MGRGFDGMVLKLMRSRDFQFTVTGADDIVEDRYRRLGFTDGGMLADLGVHPTMWVRMWFDDGGRPHQRAYTIVDPDPAAGTFSVEFALHRGCASDWARKAQPGDTIEATVQGTGFTDPRPRPDRLLVIGDAASLPAINSLLDAFPDVPATVWFETAHASDPDLPMRTDATRHDVRFVPREHDGARLVETVRRDLPGLVADPARALAWIACDTKSTRALNTFARKELGLPKDRVKALGYWRAH